MLHTAFDRQTRRLTHVTDAASPLGGEEARESVVGKDILPSLCCQHVQKHLPEHLNICHSPVRLQGSEACDVMHSRISN